MSENMAELFKAESQCEQLQQQQQQKIHGKTNTYPKILRKIYFTSQLRLCSHMEVKFVY
jgi:hypothetical protein